MSLDQLFIMGATTTIAFLVFTFFTSSKPTKRKKFEGDLSDIEDIEDKINLLANQLADRSAEYYRRYQLEADEEDLMLSNSLHSMVNDLKKLEGKIKPGSVVQTTLSRRVKEEPGWMGSLIGKTGRQPNGSKQTEMVSGWSDKEEEALS